MKCLYTRDKSSHTHRHTWGDDDVNQCDRDANETVWNLALSQTEHKKIIIKREMQIKENFTLLIDGSTFYWLSFMLDRMLTTFNKWFAMLDG